MKPKYVLLTEEQANLLAKKSNGKTGNEIVREALDAYFKHISTDTMEGIGQSLKILQQDFQEMQEKFIEQYEIVERLSRDINELTNR